MKIALISESFPPISMGGVSTAHFNLYKLLKKHGFECKVFTFNDMNAIEENNDEIVRNVINRFFIKIVRRINTKIFRFIDPGFGAYQTADVAISMFGAVKVRFAIKKFNPNLIIVPDHGAPGLVIKKKNAKMIMVSHHNPIRFIANPLLGNCSIKDAKIAVAADNLVLRKADAVICPSVYMKEVFLKTYKYNGKIAVIPNNIDNEYIESIDVVDVRGQIGLREKSILIYIPSAGSIFKGAKYVEEIIRRVAKAYKGEIGFYLSGDINDTLKYELNKRCDNKTIIFTPGILDYEKNIGIIKSCSFCISPTLIESFGMAILEANFCGLPVVTFNVGGNKDIIKNGINGYIVPPLDVEDLVKYSIKLLRNKNRKEMSTLTKQYVYKRFNSDLIALQYKKIIDQL